MTPPATDRLRSLASTVYVVEQAKVLYTKASKSACTTMLWTIIELDGRDPATLPFAARPSVMRSQVVHDASIHPVPTIDKVSPELRHEALTSDEWMRLAIIRDPYARLYSAWESRILLDNPGQWQSFPQPDLVRIDGRIDVTESFRSFVAAMVEHRGIWQADPHFAQQVYVLALDEIDYTDLIPTSELNLLFERLSERVGRSITARKSNEGLSIKPEQAFDAATAARAEELYDL
jgi:Sulfotransferase family